MDELQKRDAIPGLSRDIETVTTEIRELCRQAQSMALMYVIEVGRRLYEAKSLLDHGEWSGWLKEKVNFSQSSANNYMRIFDEYGAQEIGLFGCTANSQTLGNLSYTKALRLIAIPEDERESFAEENDVEHLSARELDRLIKERDDAVKAVEEARIAAERAEDAKTEAEEAAAEAERLKAEIAALKEESRDASECLEKANEKIEKQKEQLKELKTNPTVSEDVLRRIKLEAEQKASEAAASDMAAKLKATEERAGELASKLTQAQSAAETAKRLLAESDRKVQMANPDAMTFKALFIQSQEIMAKLHGIILKVRQTDAETADKLQAALAAFIKKEEGLQ